MADQAINALSTKTAPETSDQLLLVGTGEPQLIDYDKLADAILNKITSKNYALDAGTMTLLAALNKLNSDKANYGSYTDDLNNIPVIVNEQTIYRVIPNCKNSPAQGEHGILRTMYIDNSKYAIQEFLSHANTKLFIRSKSNNVWGNWVEK